MTRVVFWDFDGTLGYGPHGRGAWAPCLIEALEELHPGHGLLADDVRPFTRGGYPWHRHAAGHVDLDSADKWWASLEVVFRDAFERLGFRETAGELACSIRRLYADGSRWGLYEDASPALERVRSEGWRNVVFSNNIPELEGNLTLLGLDDVVERVVCSAVIGFEKPHPEAYRRALRAAGNPAACWMVGDSYEADVVGAEAVGIPAILVRREHPEAKRWAPDLGSAVEIIAAGVG